MTSLLIPSAMKSTTPLPYRSVLLAGYLRHIFGISSVTFTDPLRARTPGPDGVSIQDLPEEEMITPLEKVPAVASVDEALSLLVSDRELCMDVLSDLSDERLLSERSAAPWGGPEVTLLQHCTSMIWHLGQHKGQLFYYLKLQGKDVNTMHLWGG